MSSCSDSDEFFDAHDDVADQTTEHGLSESVPDIQKKCLAHDFEAVLFDNPIEHTPYYDACDKQEAENGKSWLKFKELRDRMQTEEEDGAVSNSSPIDSQVSSVDDVFAGPSTKMLHPFRVIEHDTLSVQSMTSLGRVGRILSGNVEASGSSGSMETKEERSSGSTDTLTGSVDSRWKARMKPDPQLQEPDVVVSAKNAAAKRAESHTRFVTSQETIAEQPNQPAPIAPPRRKKKQHLIRRQSDTTSNNTDKIIPKDYTPLCNSETTIENLTRQLENSLDITLTSKGQYVVKPQPQDDESKRMELRKADPPARKTSMLHGNTCPPGCSASLARNSSTYPLSSSSSHSVAGTRGGLGLRLGVSPQRGRERRKSTGDEQLLPHALNMFVRTRTDSGKQLTDMEILEQVTVLNLDTGERVPLSIAEDKLPQCMNPLSLHIMRLTSEYVSEPSLEKGKESDEESVSSSKKSFVTVASEQMREPNYAEKLKHLLGVTVRKTVSKAKTIAHEVSHSRHKDDSDKDDIVGNEPFKLRASNSHKGPYEFQALQNVQELSGGHVGAVWCMKFSSCGRLLATAGQDRILRIWVVRNAYTYFQEMRTKYNAEKVSPTPSQESLVSQQSLEDPSYVSIDGSVTSEECTPFMSKPFCTYTGHTSDLLDVSWSKNYFVLSSSMDKTVRLWHISRKECLCCFQHIDFVTAICFHPRDDRFFLSGSLDGKLRLWNIPDKKVAVWNELDGTSKLITAANFCQNGKFAVVGSYDGRCLFYKTDQLSYHTQIHVRSTRGKNARGRKISGIEPMPGEDKILVTSNDSRIRLYDLIDLNLSCKYKGYSNVSSQIKASFSHDGKFIICGSENQWIYIWKTHHDYSKFSSVRRDRNDFWEGIKAHNAVVTCAIFAPNPEAIIQQLEPESNDALQNSQRAQGYVLVSADFNGCIRVFLNKTKPKHSSLPASALA